MNAPYFDPSSFDHEIEYGCACLERDLGALEQSVAYGCCGDDLGVPDYGAAGGVAAAAAGVGTMYATGVTGGMLASGVASAGAYAAGGAGMIGTSAAGAGSLAVAAGGTLAATAVLAAPAALAAAGVGWLASWRADMKNIARLKAKIQKLRTTMRVKVARAQGSGRKARLKRRYERRIGYAQKRLDRIERVMKRRIERAKSKGKGLTARQKRLAQALGIGAKKRGKKGLSGTVRARRSARGPRDLLETAAAQARAAIPNDDYLPDAGELPEGSLAEMEAGDYADDEPVYKQTWFLALAGVVVIGGILYTTRSKGARS